MFPSESPMLALLNQLTTEQPVPTLRTSYFSYSTSHSGEIRFLPELSMEKDLVFFEEDNPYWITEADFQISVLGADIKLELWDFQGKVNVLLPTSRQSYNKDEIITFKINGATNKLVLLIDEKVSVSLIALKVSGRSIDELVSIMREAEPVWKVLGEDYDQFRANIASDIKLKSDEFLELQSETNEVKNKLLQHQQSLELNQTQVEAVSKYLSEIQEQHSNVTEQVNGLLKEKTSLSNTNKELKISLSDKDKQLVTISQKLTETREKLKSYKSDASLYSEDFSEYKNEIKRQNTIYKWILGFLFVAGSILSFNMYQGVNSLSSDLQFNFDIWSLLVSRLPIISFNIFVLGVCSTIIYKMIELITQNNERVSLTKQIAYLVKECSDSQSEDLDLSDEQILTKRVVNKMSLIREFIGSQADEISNNKKA